jgi:hypothetical protein
MYEWMSFQKVRCCCWLAAAWFGLVALTCPVDAETARQRRLQADEFIREALHSEIYAETAERQRLLARSLELAPDHPPARWQNGYVKYFNRWLEADSVPQIEKLQERLALYENQRYRTPQNAGGWLALANWCAQNDFPLQERAHLSQILQEIPDHPEVRRRLGFKRVGGMWVEGEALWNGLQQTAANQANLRKWTPRLTALAKKLRSREEAKRTEAEEELLSMTSVGAIPALERMAATSEQDSRIVIRVLGRMPYHQASAALARLGVFLPWPNARYRAATQLGQHPDDNYIPGLLAEMATPITSRVQSLQRNGRLLYRHVFVREVQNQTQTAVLDTLFLPDYVVLGDGEVSDVDFDAGFNDLLARVFETAVGRERQRLAQNQLIAGMNRRICRVLQVATGRLLDEDPQVWWAWWDEENQIKRLGTKQNNQEYRQQTQSYIVPVYTSQRSEGSLDAQPDSSQPASSSPDAPRSQWPTIRRVDGRPIRDYDCFVAGTPVWTARGPVNIELVEPGDLVLSQDANSGELDYKPVLQAIRRVPETLVKILTAEETLEATGGHALWVNGEGWVMVRELKSGMVLHGANGSVTIRDVLPGSQQTTYNLVVADFHAYFAGQGKVLSHDNTSRRPTNAEVPGLAKRAY